MKFFFAFDSDEENFSLQVALGIDFDWFLI